MSHAAQEAAHTELDALKHQAAAQALDEVHDGMVIGLGSGSTARLVIEGIGRLVQGGLHIRGVPTSEASAVLAARYGIPVAELTASGVDLAIDGADEIDPQGGLIKGWGGALMREKQVATAARRFVVVADETKRVRQLGSRGRLPVEIIRWGWEETAARLTPYHPTRRIVDGQPFITDNGNYILDCAIGPLADAAAFHRELKQLVAVVETGLFLGVARRVIVATAQGVVSLEV